MDKLLGVEAAMEAMEGVKVGGVGAGLGLEGARVVEVVEGWGWVAERVAWAEVAP